MAAGDVLDCSAFEIIGSNATMDAAGWPLIASTGGTIAVTSAYAHKGTTSLRVSQTGAGSLNVQRSTSSLPAIPSGKTALGVVFRIKVNTLPNTSAMTILELNSVAGGGLVCYITSAGVISIKDISGTGAQSLGTAVAGDEWMVELTANFGLATNLYTGRATKTGGAQGSTLSFSKASGASTWSSIVLGHDSANGSSATGDYAIDSLVVLEGATLPGDYYVQCIRPNADVDLTWTVVGGAGSRFASINETTPNDITTYLQSSTSGAIQRQDNTTFTLGAGDVIKGLKPGLRLGSSAVTTSNVVVRLQNAAGTNSTLTDTLDCSINGWKNGGAVTHLINPAGGAWSQTELDGIRLNMTKAASAAVARVSTAWIDVAVQAATTISVSGSDSVAVTETGTVASSVPSSDSVAGTETGAIVATLPDSDSGTFVESSSIVVTLSGSDTITATDTTVRTNLVGSDSATIVESSTTAATLSGSDTITGAEGTPKINLSDSDAGTGTESGSVAATLAGSDSGTGTESSTLAASLSGVDSGTFTELGALVATVLGSDSVAVTETGTIAATLSSTDSGTVVETSKVGLSGSDTVTGTEGGTIAATLTGSDTIIGTDASSNGRSGADSGTFVETGTIAASLSGSDSGTFVENGSVGNIPIVGSDSGTFVESSSIVVTLTASDSGSVVETWAISAALTGADTVTGTDSNGSVSAGNNPTGSDAGTFVESSTIVATLVGSDSLAGVDTGTLVASVLGSDTLHGTDASATAATLPGADSGAVTESGQVQATLAGADSLHGTESQLTGITGTDVGHFVESGVLVVNLSGSDQFVFTESTFIVAALSGSDFIFADDEGTPNQTGGGVALLVPLNRSVTMLTLASRSSVATLTPVSRSAGQLTPVAEPIAELEPQ